MVLRTVILGRFPAKRLLENGRVIWEANTVTIMAVTNDKGSYTFEDGSVEDPASIFKGFMTSRGATAGERKFARFHAPVVCDREVEQYGNSKPNLLPGQTIPAGTLVIPTGAGKHVFTPLED